MCNYWPPPVFLNTQYSCFFQPLCLFYPPMFVYFGFLWLFMLFPCVLLYLPKRFKWSLITFSKFKKYLSGCNNRRHNFFKTLFSQLGTLDENWLGFDFAWRAWSNRVSEDSDSSWLYFEISFWNKLPYHVRRPLWMDHKGLVDKFSF